MRFRLPSQQTVMQCSRQSLGLAEASSCQYRVLLSVPSSRCSRAVGGSVFALQSDHCSSWRRAGARATCNQRSLHGAMPAAPLSQATVDTRSVVTRASAVSSPVFGVSDIWQWRKAQLQKIALFTGPALSIPLADPIMSLVDTVCVGQVLC